MGVRWEIHQGASLSLLRSCLFLLPTNRLSFCAVAFRESHTLPLTSKVSITGNMAWSKSALSSVLPKKASSLRDSLLPIAKLYRWPKPCGQQKCSPRRKQGSHLTAAASWRCTQLPFGSDSSICTMFPDSGDQATPWCRVDFCLKVKLFT